MLEPKTGRILAASLHQAINELLPTRVEFYESWLSAGHIRKGELGRAHIAAVVSFLRQEGTGYDAVMQRAGQYAADWTTDAVPGFQLALVRRLPESIRVRVVLRMVSRMIRALHGGDGLQTVTGIGAVVVTVDRSFFCDVRELTNAPMCRYYGAALERCLGLFKVPARAQFSLCRATGDNKCELIIQLGEWKTGFE